jgi:hypothetical protein
MEMFKRIFLLETQKFFCKRNIKIFFTVFFILAVFSYEGIYDYKKVIESKIPFQDAEKQKVTLLIHYTFYGIRGVRLLLIPSPLSVLYNDLSVYSGLTANVDSAEGLSLTNSLNGKELFAGSGGYMDFSGLMLLITGFLALIYGHNITRDKDYLIMLADISKRKNIQVTVTLVRMILLSVSCFFLYCLCLLWLGINGIPINASFFLFPLILLPVVVFFVGTGAFIGYRISKPFQFPVLAVLYFSLMFLIPWGLKKILYIEATNNISSTYELEYEKLKVMMDFEKRFYRKHGVWKSKGVAADDIKNTIQSGQDIEYKKLQEYENNRIESLSWRIKVYQVVSSFFPTTFYLSSNQELSGKGHLDFIRFYRYAHYMKYQFIKFYIEKKFYQPLPASGVEPFVKGDENLFESESRLPLYFPLGFGITLIYILSMLIFLNKSGRPGAGSEGKTPFINFAEGRTSQFILCGNDRIKDEFFRCFRQQPNTCCIEKINAVDCHLELGPKETLKHFCRISGVNEEKAAQNFSLLNSDGLEKETTAHETLIKIYAAVKMSGEHEYIVLDNFFKNESRRLENAFLPLLTAMEEVGKKIIYLDCDYYYSRGGMEANDKFTTHTYMVFDLPLGMVTLR